MVDQVQAQDVVTCEDRFIITDFVFKCIRGLSVSINEHEKHRI